MRGSWNLGRVAGIGVYVHWTFLLLLLWVVGGYLVAGFSWAAAMEAAALVIVVFGCVVLHELGHALTARRYGIVTQDITLLPIGGVARLLRIPEDPWQELIIALAGPAVNVVIAAALIGLLVLLGQIGNAYNVAFEGGHFLVNLMWINVLLVAFNLLPAFPMDGGRVLRALLGFGLPYVRATQIAARLGQVMAVLFGIAGLYVNIWLVVIGIFIFMAAQQELTMAKTRAAMEGALVTDAMLTHIPTAQPSEMLDGGVLDAAAACHHDIPVVEHGHVAGLLKRSDLLVAVRGGQQRTPVSQWMRTDFPSVQNTQSLHQAYEQMQSTGLTTVLVLHDHRLLGVVTGRSIADWAADRVAHRQGDFPTSPPPSSDQPHRDRDVASYEPPTQPMHR